MPQELTKKPLSNRNKWLWSTVIWLVMVLIFSFINLFIYISKSAAGTGVMQYLSVGFEGFMSMIKLLLVLPAMWLVAITQLVTGSDSIFKGAELGMTGFLWATPYVFIPLSYWIIGKVSKKS